jgi:DNA-binding LacI/PurR family transcriptional regulator
VVVQCANWVLVPDFLRKSSYVLSLEIFFCFFSLEFVLGGIDKRYTMWYTHHIMKPIFKTSNDIYEELIQRCLSCGPTDSRILPGERILAEQLQTTRTTLRKAMALAEQNGFLRRFNKQNEIIYPANGFRRFKKLLFCASGHNDEFRYAAFQRLWLALSPQLDNLGIQVELAICADTQQAEKFAKKDFDLILSAADRSIHQPFEERKAKYPIIAVGNLNLDFCDNYIVLDDYAVGELAAKALIVAGSKNPTFIYQNTHALMFFERERGFTDTLKQVGIKWKRYSMVNFVKEHFALVRRKELLNAFKDGCDGAFLLSDENIEFITHDLVSENLVPEKINLITLNGSGQCQICQQPIACVTHATESVTRAITSHLIECEQRGEFIPVKKLIKPHLRLNHTLRKMDFNILNLKKEDVLV